MVQITFVYIYIKCTNINKTFKFNTVPYIVVDSI